MKEQFAVVGIGKLCGLFGKSRQAWYEASWQGEIRNEEHAFIIEFVTLLRRDMPRIGCHKLYFMLQGTLLQHNISIGRDKFFDVLRDYGLMLRKKRRKSIRTTFSNHWMRRYPNLIINFIPQKPEQLWVSDITYVAITKGFLYLSLITDAYSHRIVGWCLSRNLSNEGCLNALEMALSIYPATYGLIHHSDRGLQYCSSAYVNRLKTRGMVISMTENGDPLENAIAERVNGILKTEFDLDQVFSGFRAANNAVKKSIGVYNGLRPHASCNYLTPMEAHSHVGILPKRWKNYYRESIEEVKE